MAWSRRYDEAEPQRVNRWLAQSGVCSRREAEALIGRGLVSIDGVTVVDAASLEEAVATACGWARDGGVVLLSPAAPSFGRFADYNDRARAFAEAASKCGPLTEQPT